MSTFNSKSKIQLENKQATKLFGKMTEQKLRGCNASYEKYFDSPAGEISKIQQFYEDKTIFVTGGTGFLGKMTVEKLLRSCNVRKIFLLVRPKRGEEARERFEKYFDSPMFENLAEQKRDFKAKVVFVSGDLQRPNLGLVPEDVELITREVEVIFHWAATLNFTEDIKTATDINVKSVRDLLVMARNMPQLKSFLYVSTAYSHCLRSEIQEDFYDDTIEGKKLIMIMDCFDAKMANDITPGFLGEWPNSYVYTKAAAENLIKTEGSDLPVGILRPSIVQSCYREPIPGWIDNLYGFIGLAIAGSLGYIRVACGDPDKIKLNLVPADSVVNCGIAAAWQISNDKPKVAIYNTVVSPAQIQTFRKTMDLTYKYATQIPSVRIVWHYFIIFVQNRRLFTILDFLLHYLPARFADFIFVCIRRKPRFFKIYKKVNGVIDALIFFSKGEWSFTKENTLNLYKSLSEKDKEDFDFYFIKNSIEEDVEDYVETATLGVRLYLLKDPIETLPAGKRKMRMFKYAHYTLVTLLLYVFCWLTYQVLKYFI